MIRWFRDMARECAREMQAVFHDIGVMIFFFALPTVYPIVYTLIYNPEIVEEMPVAIVDESCTARSRQLVRMIDATQAMTVYSRPANMGDARQQWDNHEVVAIIQIPHDYDRRIGRGEQAVVPYYCDMSLLLRYRALLSSLTDVQMALGEQFRTEFINNAGEAGQMAMSSKPVATDVVILGDTTQGFASFVMPGLFVLILQQSMMLGICMLAGGRAYRRRMGLDPQGQRIGGVIPTILGRTLCYVLIYIPLAIYIVTVVPWIFSLPSVGSMWTYMLYLLPLLVASAMMGQAISIFVTERESSMLVIVFSSVIFLFLSGLTWPRYAMGWFWHAIGSCIPATWGVEGFVRLASNGGTLAEQSSCYYMMWILALCWALPAALSTLRERRRPR